MEAQQKKDVLYIASERILEHLRSSKASGARIAALESENEKLRADATSLRRILARSKVSSDAERRSPDPEVVTKASEFLVVLPKQCREYAFSLFETGQLLIEDVVRGLGVEATQHFANLLGWSEVGYVSGHMFIATRLGTALGKTVKSIAEEASLAVETSEPR